jgi:hypothetical protein
VVRVRAERLTSDVAEIQGLYGAFSFPEKLLQKIWLRRDFDRDGARTVDGRRVQVIDPGKWNLLGGPDFRVARLRFDDGPEVIGDVELHLRSSDWDVHAHARDPAYNNVVLHVVLFWPEAGQVTRGGGGKEIPVLPLLPLLHHDLEEYAADEAVESLSNRPTARLTNELAVFPPRELKSILELHAAGRWRQKIHFARLRVQRLGWENACHHAALEVLGFRFNRSPMLRVAGRWPLTEWKRGQVNLHEVYESESDGWSVQGVRPANHPRSRLRQYAAWTVRQPDWPTKLAAMFEAVRDFEWSGMTTLQRRANHLTDFRMRVGREICGDAIGGTRLDNVICDAFLPLVATKGADFDRCGCWFHWFAGDLPPFVHDGLRHLGVWDRRQQPACHGLAQGLLGWLIEREVRH